MRNVILVVIVFISAAIVCFSQTTERAATVITSDGKEYSGKIISEDSKQIVIEDGGVSITVLKTQITSIKYFTDLKKAKKINDDFPFLGISILMPGGVNIVTGHEFGKFGARVTAGYIGAVAGIQGNFLINLSRSDAFNHHFSVGVGTSYVDVKKTEYFGNVTVRNSWTYVGGFYDLNFHGFFLETGLSVGSGSYSNPQFMIQLGYVYEFR